MLAGLRLAAAAARVYRVAVLGAGGREFYPHVIMSARVYSKRFHPGDLTAGAAPVGLRASFRTIRVDMLCRVFALRMLAPFRGLLRIPVGHPLIVLTCFGHRVRAVTAYIGHFYFCTVLDAVLVSAKLILAVLDSISTLLTGRSAIANGSARAIGTAASVLLGTAGGLDLRAAANGHMALAICAAADACAAAVPVTLLHSRHLERCPVIVTFASPPCTAANGLSCR